jgi:UDP-N-acetylmuramate dehydrogenase
MYWQTLIRIKYLATLQLQYNISLRQYNTFGLDVLAEQFSIINDVESLTEILRIGEKKLIVLGGGSNVLFTGNIQGLVVRNEIPGINKTSEDDKYVYVTAGAGVNWHLFVMYCIENNYAGVENLALIPGSVGASPMQNIGAYGVELKDVFHSLNAIHRRERKIVSFTNDACEFGYRESVFKLKYKDEFVITDVTFRLRKQPVYNTSYGAIESELEKMGVQELSVKAIAKAVMNIRKSKLPDPAVIGNAGSFFKNPEVGEDVYLQLKSQFPSIAAYKTSKGYKLAAAWLIEQCGWKGYRKEDAGCHDRQPLVLVNYGHATGAELLDLSSLIMSSVEQKFNVRLEREVNVIT